MGCWKKTTNYSIMLVVWESNKRYLTAVFTETFTVWPDKKLGPFGPKDKRFPLPGHVGHTIKPPAPVVLSVTPTENVDPEAIFDHLPSERYNSVLKQTQEDIETVRISWISCKKSVSNWLCQKWVASNSVSRKVQKALPLLGLRSIDSPWTCWKVPQSYIVHTVP